MKEPCHQRKALHGRSRTEELRRTRLAIEHLFCHFTLNHEPATRIIAFCRVMKDSDGHSTICK